MERSTFRSNFKQNVLKRGLNVVFIGIKKKFILFKSGEDRIMRMGSFPKRFYQIKGIFR